MIKCWQGMDWSLEVLGKGSISRVLDLNYETKLHRVMLQMTSGSEEAWSTSCWEVRILVLYCCRINYPKTWWLATMSMGREFKSGFVGQFWLRRLHSERQQRLHHLKARLGLEDLLPRWRTHKAVSRRAQFPITQTSPSVAWVSSKRGGWLPRSKWSKRESMKEAILPLHHPFPFILFFRS